MELKEVAVSSELLVDGILLKAYRDRVRLPDGQTSVREWVAHLGASAVVPLFADGTTCLVRQYRYAPQRVFLEVPAGKLDHPGEAPEDVALRELEEETGYQAKTLHALGSFYPCIGYSNECIHVFVAKDLQHKQQNLDAGERLEVVRLPFAAAVEKARRGELLDMKTALILLMADEYVRNP